MLIFSRPSPGLEGRRPVLAETSPDLEEFGRSNPSQIWPSMARLSPSDIGRHSRDHSPELAEIGRALLDPSATSQMVVQLRSKPAKAWSIPPQLRRVWPQIPPNPGHNRVVFWGCAPEPRTF